MSALKKCKAVLIPANEGSKAVPLWLNLNNQKPRLETCPPRLESFNWQPRHLGIISNDPIMKDNLVCWKFNANDTRVLRAVLSTENTVGVMHENSFYPISGPFMKKLVACTDKSLKTHSGSCFGTMLSGECKHYVPQPSKQFVIAFAEDFNSGKPIGDVMVEYDLHEGLAIAQVHEGIDKIPTAYLPKVNSKDNTITIRKIDAFTDQEMYENMQYYMEYCQRNGYVTPMDWLEKHKHF